MKRTIRTTIDRRPCEMMYNDLRFVYLLSDIIVLSLPHFPLVQFHTYYSTTKVCIKSPCTSISASSAVLAVQGLLRQILQGIPFLGKLDRDRRGNCKVWERRHWESDIQDIPFLVVWLSRERGVTADRVVKDIP